MQSTTFRLLSTVVTVALLVSLGAVIIWVLQTNPTVPYPPAMVDQAATATDAQLIESTVAASTPSAERTLGQEIAATGSPPIPPAPLELATPTLQQTPQSVVTSVPVILQPTPTPTAVTAMQEPLAFVRTPTAGWSLYSNGNQVYDLVVLGTTIWAATGGGVIAWDRTNNVADKVTTLDGLLANRTTTVVNCPLPGLGLVFGTAHGLQIYDEQQSTWQLRNSRNSAMRYDAVAALDCTMEHGLLVIGYQQDGVDLYDAASDEWRSIERSSGLQQEQVTHLAVVGALDELWMASTAGLSVLTSEGLFVFAQENSPLEAEPISALLSDEQGVIWLSAGNKVYAIDGETWTIYSAAYVLASPFPTATITALHFDAEGALWIGSAAGELCKFDPVAVNCDLFFTAQELSLGNAQLDDRQLGNGQRAASAITALATDDQNWIYVATAGAGLRLYDEAGWRVFTLPNTLVGNHPVAMTQDAAGYLWVATEVGLEQLDPTQLAQRNSQQTRLFTRANSDYPVTDITVLAAEPAGGLWVGGDNAAYFDGEEWTVLGTEQGLVDARVQALAVDGEGRTWFGTAGGLSIWNGDSFFNLGTAAGMPADDVTALLRVDDVIWIGTTAGLLRYAEGRLQIYNRANSRLPNEQIQALTQLHDGTLLIGTAAGLARFIDTTISVIPEFAAESITALAAMPNGNIWLATAENGLVYFNGVRWLGPPNGIRPPSPLITLLFVDQQDQLWIGGAGGLLRYVPSP